jgi:hypothetical protein
MELQTDLLTQTAPLPALGYSKSNGNFNSTLEIFKIKNCGNENHSTDSPPLLLRLSRDRADHGELKEKYKSLIRQLPSKPYLETLSRTYFREVNYEYYPLDEDIFRDHLKDWNNLSFSTLSKGPQELTGDLRFFPALLFQMLALALQFQPLDDDSTFEALKYTTNMSFDDLASDYSETGAAITLLLGKEQAILVMVQSRILTNIIFTKLWKGSRKLAFAIADYQRRPRNWLTQKFFAPSTGKGAKNESGKLLVGTATKKNMVDSIHLEY